MQNLVLAVVGAGEASIPILNKAKQMGITTIAFGEGDSLAKSLADEFFCISIFDVDGMAQICLEKQVKGVIASSEITTESAAQLASRLDLPGNRCLPSFLARNKFAMREALKQAKHIKQPNYYLYNNESIHTFPVIVKAIDACGKRGITLVKSSKDFEIALENAMNESSDHSVLIEEYISDGQEVSVECLANGDEKYVIQITEKVTSGPPHFTEIAHHQPAAISPFIKEKVVLATNEILSLLGVTCGMAHLELKIVNNDIYFIEVGARAGGDHIADILVGMSTNYDYYKGAIECCFGKINPPIIKNVAYAGIIFNCWENRNYCEVFKKAKTADWCVDYNVISKPFVKVNGNVEAIQSGYIIYCSDHKLTPTLDDDNCFLPCIINDREDAFELMWKHNKEIGRNLSDTELRDGLHKFIEKGNAIAIINDNQIIAFLLLYCNNYETLEAYICNVYVLEEYRGLGLSKLLMEKAIDICIENSFKTIKLHVDDNNTPAISLYKKFGFVTNGKNNSDDSQIEMIKSI